MEHSILSQNAVSGNIGFRPDSHQNKPSGRSGMKEQHSIVERLRRISSMRDAHRGIAFAPKATMEIKAGSPLFGQGKSVIRTPQRRSEYIADSILAAARGRIHFSHSKWKMMHLCFIGQLANLLCDAIHQFRA